MGTDAVKGGFFQVPNVLIRQLGRELGATGVAVYNSLAMHANFNRQCWPKHKLIADELCLSPRTVRRALAKLRVLGLVVIKQGIDHEANTYTLTEVDGLNLFFEARVDTTAARVDTTAARVDTTAARVDTSGQARVDTRAPQQYPEETIPKNNTHEQEEEPPKLPPSRQDADRKVLLPPVLDTAEFQATWESWKSYRREIRKPLKPSTEAAQLKKLAGWGVAKAVASLMESITQGWTGFFPPDKQVGDFFAGIKAFAEKHNGKPK